MPSRQDHSTPAGGLHLVARNRRASHDYEILDTAVAGLVLAGTEVKSLRNGDANLTDGYARIETGEVFLHGVRIEPYAGGNRANHDPGRSRKLLLHRAEIRRLAVRTEEKGLTMVPLRLFFQRGWAKVEIGVVRGKREYDRRREIARRDARLAVDRALAARGGQ